MTGKEESSTKIKRATYVMDVGGNEMDPKLTLLFMLIGTIISLSHLGDESLANKRGRWRNAVLVLLSLLTSAGKL